MTAPTEPTGAREDEDRSNESLAWARRLGKPMLIEVADRERIASLLEYQASRISTLQSALATARQERDDLKLQLSVVNTDKAAWWEGHDVAVAGVAERWKQALETPIPKPGVMNEPLESLYRATEFLRARIVELEREGKDDAARLDWLQSRAGVFYWSRRDAKGLGTNKEWLTGSGNFRANIDAARALLATPPADGGAGGRKSDG